MLPEISRRPSTTSSPPKGIIANDQYRISLSPASSARECKPSFRSAVSRGPHKQNHTWQRQAASHGVFSPRKNRPRDEPKHNGWLVGLLTRRKKLKRGNFRFTNKEFGQKSFFVPSLSFLLNTGGCVGNVPENATGTTRCYSLGRRRRV